MGTAEGPEPRGAHRRLIMDAIGLAVADALPPEYRGVYRNADDFADARTVLRDVRDAA